MTSLKRIYLDANATTPLRETIDQAMLLALREGGNASSVHFEGRKARALIETARATLADFLSLREGTIIFVSGGSEANRLALQPGNYGRDKGTISRLVCSELEHPSVSCGGGFSASAIDKAPVTREGLIDLNWLASHLKALSQTNIRAMVSVMAANNETGVIQPIDSVSALCRAYGHCFHCDAAQALGRLDLSQIKDQADLISLTAHKAGGPIGVGALLTPAPATKLPGAVICGGGQEKGYRAGTENITAISGFAALINLLKTSLPGDIATMRDLQVRLEAGLISLTDQGVILGQSVNRLPNTTALWHPDMNTETLLMRFDLAGLSVSAGSACSSGKVGASSTLKAMGLSPASALRFSTHPSLTSNDIDEALRRIDGLFKR